MSNIKLNSGFSQVCVWPGTTLGSDEVQAFVDFFRSELNARVQYLESIETYPDRDTYGNSVADTGGRSDIVFAVHNDDVGHFALTRFRLGVRWIEDVLSDINGSSHLYPERIRGYCSWSA